MSTIKPLIEQIICPCCQKRHLERDYSVPIKIERNKKVTKQYVCKLCNTRVNVQIEKVK